MQPPSDDGEDLGVGLKPGDPHYRAYVGPPEDYDLIAAMTFNLLTTLGLRQHHSLLDVGCGSLRIGRLLIPYLNQGKYFGVEPNEWLVEEGIKRELGEALVQIKRPTFFFSDSPEVVVQAKVSFDFALAQSIFSHCGLDLIGGWLSAVSRSLESWIGNTRARRGRFLLRQNSTRRGSKTNLLAGMHGWKKLSEKRQDEMSLLSRAGIERWKL